MVILHTCFPFFVVLHEDLWKGSIAAKIPNRKVICWENNEDMQQKYVACKVTCSICN